MWVYIMLKNARLKKGLKQCELAEKLNISPPYLSKLEKGTYCSNVSINLIDKISTTLELEPVDVFEHFYNSYKNSNLK